MPIISSIGRTKNPKNHRSSLAIFIASEYLRTVFLRDSAAPREKLSCTKRNLRPVRIALLPQRRDAGGHPRGEGPQVEPSIVPIGGGQQQPLLNPLDRRTPLSCLRVKDADAELQ